MMVSRSVLAVVLLATAMSNLDQSIVGVALPTIRQTYAVDVDTVQWVVLAYQLAIVAVLLIAGQLTDRIGARRIFLGGLTIFTLASLLCAVALTIEQLIVFRGMQGVGAAMLLVTGQTLLTDAYPAAQRGSAMSYMHMAVAIGLTIGPSLGGLLIAAVNWRVIFLVNLPAGIIGLWLAWRHLPTSATRMATSAPVNLSAFRTWPLIAGILAAFLTFVALASNMFLIPFALQPLMGLTAAQAGLVMITVPLTILVVAPLSGHLADRVGPRWPATAGVGLVTIAILLMSQLRSGSAVAFAVMTLVLYGIGAGFFQAPNNAAVMTAAPCDARGMVSGVLALARSLGQIGGVALAGAIWSWRQEVYERTPGGIEPLGGSLRDAFLVLAMVAVVAVVMSLLRGGIRSQQQEVIND